MKILKWGGVFVIAFAAAWILIFTFTQAQFSTSAPIKIFGYTTAQFPIYVFVASAFGIGLLIGFSAAAYYFIAGQAKIRKMTKKIKALESSLSNVDDELDKYRTATEKSKNQKEASSREKSDGKKEPPAS